jgi:hypothetical protein
MLKFSEEIKKRYDYRETLDMIERYAVENHKFPVQTNVYMEKDVQRKSEKFRDKEEELGAIAVEMCYLKNLYCLLHQALDARLMDFTMATIFCLNTDNIICFALVTRALMENAALTAFLCKQSFEKIESIERTCDCKLIRGELKGLRKKYERIFHRSGLKSGWLTDNVEAKTLIQSHLSRDIESAVDAYELISDFADPCFGGSAVLPWVDQGSGMTGKYTGQQLDIINRIISIYGKTFLCYSFRLMELMDIVYKLDNYIKKALMPTTTLENIFHELKPVYTGDGASKKTAIYFKCATSYNEHRHLQEQFINDNKIIILGKKKYMEFNDGFTIDAYRTEAGHLYFRTPPISPE